MKRWQKVTLGVVVAGGLIVGGGPLVYRWLNPADEKATDELDDRLAEASTQTTVAPPIDVTVPTTAASPGSAADSAPETVAVTEPPETAAAAGLDGTWTVTPTTDTNVLYVGYRVDEVIAGQAITATGRSAAVTGSLTLAGTQATAADFSVEVATITSDNAQRDGQFTGRIMETETFPTATFTLTAPIEFGTVPADAERITASATGDLTLRGVTRSVTFDVVGFVANNQITIAAEIPVVFADYNITNPSIGPITTEDNGALEFLIVFDRQQP
jgi:polyisoprenoid-binding protein YceI